MRKLAKVLVAALSVVGGLLSIPAVAQGKKWTKVVIATEGAFPPYNITRPDGTLDGFEIELAKDLCARMKVECPIVAQSFDGIIPALTAGKFDAIMAGMSITEKRKEVIAFSLSYGGVGQTFAVVKGSSLEKLPLNGQRLFLNGDEAVYRKAIEELKPFLKGKIIGVQTSTVSKRFLEEYFKDIVTLREYKTTNEHDLDLAAGRVDAVVASRGYLTSILKNPSNSEITLAGPSFQGGPIVGPGSGVGLRKEDTELKAMFDSAIREAIKDGTIKKLSEKWFGFDISPAE